MPKPYFKTWTKQNSATDLPIKGVDEFQFILNNDNRVIDLRTTAKHAVFRLSSGVCSLFR